MKQAEKKRESERGDLDKEGERAVGERRRIWKRQEEEPMKNGRKHAGWMTEREREG